MPKFMRRGKAVPRGNFIAVNTYIKEEGSQVNNLTFHLKKLEKVETRNSKKIARGGSNK